jgi:pimeloyl-ACP methyl ester carboxylesterase
LAAVVAVSALLASCSDSASDTSSATTPASTSATAAAPAATSSPSSTDATPDATPDDTSAPSSAPSTAPAAELPLTAPEGAAFYTPPDPVPGVEPGDLIWARPIESSPEGSNGWLVLYRSESVAGDPIAVSGVVFASTDPPLSPAPVLTWAHGTTGLGDTCAPSGRFDAGSAGDLLFAQAVNALGFTFVATDYEGLGTPGVHPYLVGISEGRGVLDIVRAAQQLDGSAVGADSSVAIFGHSQGGHAALMAAELAATWAPELNVVGTVAAAPPGDIGLIESSMATANGSSLGGGFSLMIDAGYLAAYPELPAEAVVAESSLVALDEVGNTCLGDAMDLAETVPGTQLDGTKNADWAAAYAANSPGSVVPSAPVLMIHGDADDIVPVVLSQLILDDYCAIGATVERKVYPGADHGSVLTQGLADVQFWFAQRMSGVPATSSC